MQVSIVIPCYNGSELLSNTLPLLKKYLANKPFEAKIIVVDDGSINIDDTRAITEANDCLFLFNEKNMGKGAAIRKGILSSSSDYYIYTDTDLPFDFASFDLMLSTLLSNEYDLVIGDRTLPESNYFEEITSYRKLGSKVFTFIVTNLITSGLQDTQCGFKGFKGNSAKMVFERGHVNSFAFDVEILYIALKNKLKIKRIPVALVNASESTVNLGKHAPRMLWDICTLKYYHLRGNYTTTK